jgi:hypothetical protein
MSQFRPVSLDSVSNIDLISESDGLRMCCAGPGHTFTHSGVPGPVRNQKRLLTRETADLDVEAARREAGT